MRNLLSVVSLVPVLALGCAPAAEPPAPEVDLATERAALMEADQAWFQAYSTSDSPPDTFVSQVLDDTYLLPPDAPLAQGKEAIRAVVAALEAMPGMSIAWRPTAAVVGDAGDFGYTIGAYEMTIDDPDGNPMKIVGKYLTVWQKQPDGTWMVTADMFNADGPPTPIEE